LGMLGLALFSLVMLRSMIRAVPSSPRPGGAAGALPAQPEEAGSEESATSVSARRLERFTGGGPSLRDELTDLVQEDTDAAANILRTWIGTAS
jgi:flagellar M-ring protein FliF